MALDPLLPYIRRNQGCSSQFIIAIHNYDQWRNNISDMGGGSDVMIDAASDGEGSTLRANDRWRISLTVMVSGISTMVSISGNREGSTPIAIGYRLRADGILNIRL